MQLTNKNNVQKVIESAMEKINEIKATQIVGEPIKNELGQTVIPVSSVTYAVLSGGGEYGDVKIAKEVGDHFAGGEITICSLKPNCFIIDNGNGFFITKNSDVLENIYSIIKVISEKIKWGADYEKYFKILDFLFNF